MRPRTTQRTATHTRLCPRCNRPLECVCGEDNVPCSTTCEEHDGDPDGLCERLSAEPPATCYCDCAHCDTGYHCGNAERGCPL